MGREILLYGSGGHAKVIIDCVVDAGNEVVGLFDDDIDLVSLNGYSVLGVYNENEQPESEIVLSIGDNRTRQKIATSISHRFGIAQHPSAIVSHYAIIEEGTVVMQGAVLQTGTRVGKHCIINTCASVDHDTKLGDFVHISPKACLCASVEIGDGTHIGAGATVLPGVKIGDWCVIGAGSVVNKDIPDNSVVIGVPGRVVKTLEEE